MPSVISTVRLLYSCFSIRSSVTSHGSSTGSPGRPLPIGCTTHVSVVLRQFDTVREVSTATTSPGPGLLRCSFSMIRFSTTMDGISPARSASRIDAASSSTAPWSALSAGSRTGMPLMSSISSSWTVRDCVMSSRTRPAAAPPPPPVALEEVVEEAAAAPFSSELMRSSTCCPWMPPVASSSTVLPSSPAALSFGRRPGGVASSSPSPSRNVSSSRWASRDVRMPPLGVLLCCAADAMCGFGGGGIDRGFTGTGGFFGGPAVAAVAVGTVVEFMASVLCNTHKFWNLQSHSRARPQSFPLSRRGVRRCCTCSRVPCKQAVQDRRMGKHY
uniref:Uncharacterized protein n=1 Tax=Anopheles melas TaxID=34690 RepID=A0A182TMA5_9DIPT